MHKTFIELEEKYQSVSLELKTALEKLAYYCSDFSNGEVEFDGIDYINNPFELGYDEKYSSHYVGDNKVFLTMEHKDPYERIGDTVSHNHYPLHWVEHAYNDTLDQIEDEVKSHILEYHYSENNRELKSAIHLAKHHKIISEEEAEKRLAEISGKN